MTRANIHIHLSNGYHLKCVAENSTAPEQGYFVEHFLQPLFAMRDVFQELDFLIEHCSMNEQRANACYRYIIDLRTRRLRFHEEHYWIHEDKFVLGRNITERLNTYCNSIPHLRPFLDQINFPEN